MTAAKPDLNTCNQARSSRGLLWQCARLQTSCRRGREDGLPRTHGVGLFRYKYGLRTCRVSPMLPWRREGVKRGEKGKGGGGEEGGELVISV